MRRLRQYPVPRPRTRAVFILLSWLGLFLLPGSQNAKNLHVKFEHLSIEHGLSQSSVHCILQDRQGFMWFGTQEGLNRYDGYDFKVYMHQPENLKSVGFNAQLAALEDRWGNLWFGTYSGGLERFDTRTGEFFHYKADPRKPGQLSHNFIRAIFEDSRGRLWIGTAGGGLNLLVPASNPDIQQPEDVSAKNAWAPDNVRFYSFQADLNTPGSLSHNFVKDITEDREGNLWIGTRGGGLNRVNIPPEWGTWQTVKLNGNPGPKLTFEHFKNIPGDRRSLPSNDILTLCVDSSGILWIGTKDGGLCCFCPGEPGFSRYRHNPGNPQSLCSDQVFDILEDRQGILWIGTYGGGLDTLSQDRRPGKNKGLTFIHHRHQVSKPNSLSNNIVMVLYQDTQDILWIGTDGGGLNKFDRKKYRFPHYSSIPGEHNSLSNPSIRSIFQESSGIMWLGTDDGLNRFDMKTGQCLHFHASSAETGTISHDVVRTICSDSEGTLWFGTSGGGINSLKTTDNGSRFSFVHYRHRVGQPDSLSDDTVLTMISDRKSGEPALWIGTHGGGLNHFIPRTGTWTHFRADPQTEGRISSDYIRSLYQDADGTLWVGTDGKGLNRLKLGEDRFTVIIQDPGNPSNPSTDYVLTIYESPSLPGFLWLGTLGNGLNKYDKVTGKTERYGEENGLPNNVIYGILEESDGPVLWLSTNKGLCRLDTRTGLTRTFTPADGLQSMEFNGNAFWKGKSGRLFFGGINGFNAFFPSAISRNIHVPPIVLTEFRLFHRTVPLAAEVMDPKSGTRTLEVPLYRMKELRLSYFENFFSIGFSALDYTAPDKNQYRFMLEGVDEDWISCGASQRFAHYTNIEPGEYIFRVSGANNNGAWNIDGTSLRIIISPPIWKTWWFNMTVGVLVIWLLVFLLHKRIAGVRKEAKREHIRMTREMEKRELEQELRLKADFTAMLVHELRNPLTAVMGYSELLMKNPKRANVHNTGNVIFRSTGRMLGLINDMLDISKFEAGKMHISKKNELLNKILEDNVELVTPLLEEKEIAVDFSLSKLEEISLDREKIGQVIHNFISNALKFSPVGGTIRFITHAIEINRQSYQELSVIDEGPGVPEESREHLFDKYAQLKSNVTVKGTGLGLAVSRLIIDAHNGRIGYKPGPKRGSVFYFRLPW